MDGEEIGARLLSIGAEISNTKINTGNLNDQDMNKIFSTITNIDGDRIIMDYNMEFEKIMARIQFCIMKYGIDYVIIDYLQLIAPSKYMARLDRTYQLKEMSRRLKSEICMKFDIPVIIAGQLGDQALDDPIPKARRSSESKLIQADADVTIAMRKRTAKEKDLNPEGGDILFFIDKVRYNRDEELLQLVFDRNSLAIREV